MNDNSSTVSANPSPGPLPVTVSYGEDALARQSSAPRWLRRLMRFAFGGFAGLAATLATESPGSDAIDPQADALLHRMSDTLAQAQFFSVNAEIWQDLDLSSGQRVQAGRTVELQVRRPDHFRAEVRSTRRNRGLYYDGKTLNLVDRAKNYYGSIPAPASLDEALDVANERFGIAFPLEDLVVSDPYHSALGKVVSGTDLGPVTVLGVPCEHLVFSQDTIDWQYWIELVGNPVPRKVVITYKHEAGSPQYTAILSHWDFKTTLPDAVFQFEPPKSAVKIDVAEIKAKIEAKKAEDKKP